MRKRHYLVMILLVIFIITPLQIIGKSKFENNQGQKCLKEEKLEEAIKHFSRSIRWYFPGNNIKKPILGLIKAGKLAEENNDWRTAIFAYESIKASINSIRVFFSPRKELICQAEEKINRLYKQNGYNLKAKSEEYNRKPGGFIMVQVGFWGWICGIIGFIWLSFSTSGRFFYKRALLFGIIVIVFYSIWLLGLVRA